jgi:N-acetylmuramoyl-L-alanine amidase|tara:strand:- start:150 stop:695 length:546 start_codon:yes stop_codon:yes gene_type:complete
MIGIAIGHSRKGDNGAYTVGESSVSEHTFNSDLVPFITAHLKVPYKIYDDYKASSYLGAMNYAARKMREDDVDACVELHFNSAGPKATGHEWLHWQGSSGGSRLATGLKESMIEHYPSLKSRGVKSRSRGDRGALFLRKTPVAACIAEPFFGSNPEDVALVMSDLSKLGKMYAEGMNNFFA